jgi:hypothetical protein
VSLTDKSLEPADAPAFDSATVDAVLHHMNDDHVDDNLLIAQAFADRSASTSHMVHVDGLAGHWVFVNGAGVETELRVAWSAPISQRAEIRREIVVLYDRACAELGVTPRPHD